MRYFQHFIDVYLNDKKKKPKNQNLGFFSKSLTENIELFKREFGQTADLSIKYINIAGVKSALITIGGMVDKEVLTSSVMFPIINSKIEGNTGKEKYDYIKDNILIACDQFQVSNFEDAFNMVMSGFALLAMDEVDCMISLGVQGFSFRAISSILVNDISSTSSINE